jgi:inner membrane protein
MYIMTTNSESLWQKSKILIKGLLIGFIVLLLLIPTFLVRDLIEEREQRQKEAIKEVSSKWAGRQNIAGPILVIPYLDTYVDAQNKPLTTKKFAYVLPDELNIQSNVQPQERTRGIYKVMLYTAQASVTGSFKNKTFDRLQIPADRLLWQQAFVRFHLSDPKGLNEEMKMQWNDSTLILTPAAESGSGDAMEAAVPLTDANSLQDIQFSTELNIGGSEQILFTPLGKTSTVRVHAKWPHPSFTGDILPLTSDIKKDSFSAQWKSLAHKRKFPQQWKANEYSMQSKDEFRERAGATYAVGESAFGVNLFIPVNGYQKTMRSIKYAILCILLTFAAIFLIDTIHKKSVHPLQYGLIGVALVLFYVLLLSFSEYIGFNAAYAIAAIATIGLIGWFVKGVLASGRLSMLLSVILLFVYSYVFTILQLQDYALLLGSIGLFLTLAIIMHFSKKIQW